MKQYAGEDVVEEEVAPLRGGRGLKPLRSPDGETFACRSPAWGAWIETAAANAPW